MVATKDSDVQDTESIEPYSATYLTVVLQLLCSTWLR